MKCRRHIATLLMAALLASASLAQSPTQQQNAEKKPKKVLSNEDIGNLDGGVNVVGESDSWKDTAPETPDAGGTTGPGKPAAAKPPQRAPDENCNTHGLAMAISAALRAEGVMMGRGDILDRLYGGEICRPDLGNVAVLLKRMEADFTLESGRRIHIAVQYRDTFPAAVELVDINAQNRHLVIFSKGIAYVHTGIEYIERTYTSASGMGAGKDYIITSVDLLDPYRNRTVILRETPLPVEGSVLFTVSARQ